jgi:hypothetical protein
MTTITYSYNEFGYEVLVWEDGKCIHEYHAGNHKFDSAQRTCDPRWMVSVGQLRQFAAQTAREMAEGHGVPEKNIQDAGYIEDGVG